MNSPFWATQLANSLNATRATARAGMTAPYGSPATRINYAIRKRKNGKKVKGFRVMKRWQEVNRKWSTEQRCYVESGWRTVRVEQVMQCKTFEQARGFLLLLSEPEERSSSVADEPHWGGNP